MMSEFRLAMRGISPWVSHIAAAIIGATLAIWTSPPSSRKGLAAPKTEGFSIMLPAGRLTNPQEDLRLRGQKVLIVRHQTDEDEGCVIAHPPLHFQAGEQSVALLGSLEEAEATMLALHASDLRHLDIASVDNQKLPRCADQPKVIYGAESY